MAESNYRFVDRRGAPISAPARRQSVQLEPLQPQAILPGLYSTPRNTQQLDFYRPRYYRWQDLAVTINDYDWLDMLAISRQLFAQVGNLSAAIIQKNTYAVGEAWKPLYYGEDPKWGQEASEWLEHVWYPSCDVRGGVFDFQTDLFLNGLALDVDGDCLTIFARDDVGFPKFRQVPAYSIRNGTSDKEIASGKFRGAKLRNGIIVGRNDEFLGVQLTGTDGAGEQQISAANCQLLFEPAWFAQFRGIPRVGAVAMDWLDVADIDTFLKRIVKKDASIGILNTTESGEPPPGLDLIVDRTTQSNDTAPPLDVRIEKRLGGEDFYLKAKAGEKIESFESNRPSQNVEAFIARIERRGLVALGWAYELLDPSKIGGASVRLIQDIARHTIRQRQRTLRQNAVRKVRFATACGMDIGEVSRNRNGGDWMKWHFDLPAQITVDQGYDEKADSDNLRMGATTLAAIAQKKGTTAPRLRTQREVENKDWIERATTLVEYASSKGQTLTFREALDMVQQNTPNPRQPEQPNGSTAENAENAQK